MKKRRKVIFWSVLAIATCVLCVSLSINRSPIKAPNDALEKPPSGAIEQTHQVPLRSQPNNVPGSSLGQQTRYGDLPFLERNAILNEIKTKDLSSIFRIWVDAGRVDHDLLKQGDVAATLGTALRERSPDRELLTQMQEFIASDSHSINDRIQLLGELGAAATNETVNIVLKNAVTATGKEIKDASISAVSRIGTSGGGDTQEHLSLALERVWNESSDAPLLDSVAMAMAQVGSASSIELLLTAALRQDGANAIRQRAALFALHAATILNPDAVPPLAERLSSQAPTNATSKFSSGVLSRMTIPAATQALVGWLQSADATAATLVRAIVLPTENPKLWEAGLVPSVQFTSEQVRDSIRTTLAERQAGKLNYIP